MLAPLCVQLACHVLFSSLFISNVYTSMRSYCYFSSLSIKNRKKSGKARLWKAQGEKLWKKSHQNQFIWHSGKIRETAETEKPHITYPISQQG